MFVISRLSQACWLMEVMDKMELRDALEESGLLLVSKPRLVLVAVALCGIRGVATRNPRIFVRNRAESKEDSRQNKKWT